MCLSVWQESIGDVLFHGEEAGQHARWLWDEAGERSFGATQQTQRGLGPNTVGLFNHNQICYCDANWLNTSVGRFTRDPQEQEAVCKVHHRLEQCKDQVSCQLIPSAWSRHIFRYCVCVTCSQEPGQQRTPGQAGWTERGRGRGLEEAGKYQGTAVKQC